MYMQSWMFCVCRDKSRYTKDYVFIYFLTRAWISRLELGNVDARCGSLQW